MDRKRKMTRRVVMLRKSWGQTFSVRGNLRRRDRERISSPPLLTGSFSFPNFSSALLEANKFDSVNTTSRQMKDLLVGPWMQSVSEYYEGFRPLLVLVEDRG
jgi:hypothetical protein